MGKPKRIRFKDYETTALAYMRGRVLYDGVSKEELQAEQAIYAAHLGFTKRQCTKLNFDAAVIYEMFKRK
jgi:hypothetical protein